MFRSFHTGLFAVTLCVVLVAPLDVSAEYPDIPAASVCFVPDKHEVETLSTDSLESVSAVVPEGSSSISDCKFKPTQIILPGALIAVGSFGVCNGAFNQLNHKVRDGMSDLRGNHYFHADDYVQFLPAVVYLGLGFTGVKARNTFRERLAAGLTAYISMAALINITKYSVRERRPDSNARNSFPSGHTATAFTGAELIRIEYGEGWGAGAYVVATGVAFLRLYNNRHWLNDVIAGAGIGILSARIGYWMLPLYRKWFHWDSNPRSPVLAAMPAYTPRDRNVSLSIAMIF